MSERGDEEMVDKESADEEKMKEPTTYSASPFDEASRFRGFELVVEDKPVYINPHSLSEVSPYFEALCLGDFKEGKQGKAELKDVKYDDVIEMLHVLGFDLSKDRKEIDISNCASMLYAADKWNIGVLRKKCITFIESKLPGVATNFPNTMQLLLACESARVPLRSLHCVGSRLAAFGRQLLQFQRVGYAIQDQHLYGAIIVASKDLDDYDDQAKQEHELSYASTVKCSITGCDFSALQCKICDLVVCVKEHAYDFCPPRILEYQTDRNEELDHFFFMKEWPEKMY